MYFLNVRNLHFKTKTYLELFQVFTKLIITKNKNESKYFKFLYK